MSESRAPLRRIFFDFCGELFPAVLQPSREKWKKYRRALGMIALDSDNEAGYGNVDYDDTQETF